MANNGYDLGKAYIQIVPSADGISESIQSALSGSDVTKVVENTTSQTWMAAGDVVKQYSGVLTNAFNSVVDTATGYQAAMAEVQAISGVTDEQLAMLGETAMQEARATKFSSEEAAEGLKYMAMAGWQAEDMTNSLGAIMKLAGATGTDLGTTSDILTDAMTALGIAADGTTKALGSDGLAHEVSNATHFADILATTASRSNTDVVMLGESFKYAAATAGSMGYSAEDVAVALGLMANSGIKASMSGTSLRTLLVNMAKPSKDMAIAMNELGVSLEDDEGNMYSLLEVLDQLRSGFNGGSMSAEEYNERLADIQREYEDGCFDAEYYDELLTKLSEEMYGVEGAQMAQLAAMLAGKTGMAGLLSIVSAAPEDYDRLVESIYTCNGATDEMYSVMTDTAQGAMDRLDSAINILCTTMGEMLLPMIEKAADFIANLINWFNDLNPVFQTVIEGIGLAVLALGPLASVVGSIMTLVGAFNPLISALHTGVGGLFSLIAANPVLLVVAGISAAVIALGVLVFKHWDEIKEGLQHLGEWIGEKFIAIREKISDVWGNIVDTFKQVWENIQGVFSGVAEWFGELFTSAKDAVARAWEGIQEVFSNIWQGIQNVFGGVADWFSSIFSAARDAAGNAWNGVQDLFAASIDAIKSAFDGIGDWFAETFSSAKDAVAAVWATITDVFQSAWDGIKTVFDGVGTWFSDTFSAARDLAVAAWDTASDAFRNTWTAIQNVFQDVGSWFSETFAAARDLAASAWEAITERFSAVKDAIVNVYNDLGDRISSFFQAAKERIVTIWEGITTAFQSVKEKIQTVFSGVADWFGKAFESARDKAVKAWDNIKSKFATVWQNIKSAFKITDALQWGKDLINNFVKGITGAISTVKEAVSKVADTVKSVIGFSEPDTGPLANFHTYAPDMIDLFAEGLLSRRESLQEALGETFSFATPTLAQPATADLSAFRSGSTTNNSASTNIYITSYEKLDQVATARQIRKESQRLAVGFA